MFVTSGRVGSCNFRVDRRVDPDVRYFEKALSVVLVRVPSSPQNYRDF